MVEIAEVTEGCSLLGETFQKIILAGRFIVLIFEYYNEHMVEMLGRTYRTGRAAGALSKTEHRSCPKEKRFVCKIAAMRHSSSKFSLQQFLCSYFNSNADFEATAEHRRMPILYAQAP